jgi:hypothetical protein
MARLTFDLPDPLVTSKGRMIIDDLLRCRFGVGCVIQGKGRELRRGSESKTICLFSGNEFRDTREDGPGNK